MPVDRRLDNHGSLMKNRFPKHHSGSLKETESPQMVPLKRQVERLLTEAGRVKGTQKGGEAPEE